MFYPFFMHSPFPRMQKSIPTGNGKSESRGRLPPPTTAKNKKEHDSPAISAQFDIALKEIVRYGQKTKERRGEKRMDSDTGTVKRGRGRPKGSKNKPKPKKMGRPKGSKSSYTVSEKALIQRQTNVRNNTTLLPAETPEEFSYNARMIEHVMRINEIATQADRHDLLSLKSCFIAYLRLCQEDGFKVGNLAAYASMGMSNSDFQMWSRRDDPEIRQFCKFVRDTCSMFRESMVSDNKLNPVIGIFWQRNFDGLRNDTEQVQAIEEQDETYSGSKGYKERYRKLIGEET